MATLHAMIVINSDGTLIDFNPYAESEFALTENHKNAPAAIGASPALLKDAHFIDQTKSLLSIDRKGVAKIGVSAVSGLTIAPGEFSYNAFRFFAQRIQDCTSEELRGMSLDSASLHFRLLPLPRSWSIKVSDAANPCCIEFGDLPHLPSVVDVRLDNWYSRSIDLRRDLPLPVQEKIGAVGIFLKALRQTILRGQSPLDAWQEITGGEIFRQASGEISAPFMRALTADPQIKSEDAAFKIDYAWRRAFNTVVLNLVALPEIMDKMVNDRNHNFSLSSTTKTLDDRGRYWRLQLPLKELKDQDVYLNWLPLPPGKSASEIVREARDEMYGCG